ncbi:MAG: molybdopterin-dependent oxidoreductase [Deltaproteobacteria bacterium]|nr:molybdopterin-dependent oxidoreductase [Deltaproteobacteria bacterium]
MTGPRLKRREFLKLLGIGSAGALTACSNPQPEKIIPYLVPPEEIVPGRATWYATLCRECPAGCGVMARVREGRVTKVEGNPGHPVNRGALCARGQAALQGLYHPDRFRGPFRRDASGALQPASWEAAEQELATRLAELRGQTADGAVVFLGSPLPGALGQLVDRWLSFFKGRRLAYHLLNDEALGTANRLAFGTEAIPTYDVAAADYLLIVGADLPETWVSPVAFIQALAEQRAVRDGKRGQVVYLGPRLSLMAVNADRWIAIRPGSELALLLALVHVILAKGLAVAGSREERRRLATLVRAHDPGATATRTGVPAATIEELATAFARAPKALAIGGGMAVASRSATAVILAVNLLNWITGNLGRTVRFGPTLRRAASPYRDVRALIPAMEAGRVRALFVAGVNPVFSLPEGARFRAALSRVPLIVSFASVPDETTAHASLVLPDHTPLESWGDDHSWAGVHGLQQPAMAPLFGTKAVGDLLLSVARRMDVPMARAFPWPTFAEFLRESWKAIAQEVSPDVPFEAFWADALRAGGVWRPAAAQRVILSPRALQVTFEEPTFDGAGPNSFYLHPFPSLLHGDGQGADRPWLQEVPDPVTQIVWDSWIEIHPAPARRLGIVEGEVVRVGSPYGTIEAPAHITAGVHPEVVAVPMGQGHTATGRYATGVGINPVTLLSPEPGVPSGGLCWQSVRVRLERTGRRHPLVSVAGSLSQQGRGIARTIALAELTRGSEPLKPEAEPSMYPPHEHPRQRWGIIVDLNACVGCSACVVACYAENNVTVVGKEQVARGREMSWIRIERYQEDGPGGPELRFIPMLCQQCDNAPCEPVCPVYATYHTAEGLNAQVYNRCIGVRYCSNNCPYKVRRFNWYQPVWPDPVPLQLNPDVTVREKGVMEKCTFCVQRIREAQERARAEGRTVRDGEIVPACVQTCPARALVFGDLNDPASQVARLARSPRGYHVLEELNTRPAITYLKRVVSRKDEAR